MLRHKTITTLTCDICKNVNKFEKFNWGTPFVRLSGNKKGYDLCNECSSKVSKFIKTISKTKK